MRIRPDSRWGRIRNETVFEHSFGLAVEDWVFIPYCSCGWIGPNIAGMTREERAKKAQEVWQVHLITKNMKERS